MAVTGGLWSAAGERSGRSWPAPCGGSEGPALAVSTCLEGHGVLWSPVWHVAAPTLGHVVLYGGSYYNHNSPQCPVAAALWQRAVGSLQGIRKE